MKGEYKIIIIILLVYIILLLNLCLATKLPYRYKKIYVLFFSIIIAIFVFNIDPPPDWDLYRHFFWMDEIRNSSLTFTEFLFHNTEGVGLAEYRILFGFNIIRYLAIKLCSSNHLLPCICIFLDSLIVGYISIDWNRINKFNDRFSLISPLLCVSFLPFTFAVSGMRTALATAIAGLAIYVYLCKRKSMICFICLMLLAVTVHQVVLFVLPFVLMTKLNIGDRGLVFIILIFPSLRFIAPYFASSEIPFISFIVSKFLYSSSEGIIYSLFADIVLIVSFLVLYIVLRKQLLKFLWYREQKDIYIFLFYYMSFILCNLGNYDLVLRPAYLLGVFAPVLSNLITNRAIWRNIRAKKLQYLGKFLYMILCLLIAYVNIVPTVRVFLKIQ